MTTEKAEPEVIGLEIVSCGDCDQLFLKSPRRATCPTCGADAGLTFFAFTVSGDNGVQMVGKLPDAEAIDTGAGAAGSAASPPAAAEDRPLQPSTEEAGGDVRLRGIATVVAAQIRGGATQTDAAESLQTWRVSLANANQIAGAVAAIREMVTGEGNGGEPADGDEGDEEEEDTETEAAAGVDSERGEA